MNSVNVSNFDIRNHDESRRSYTFVILSQSELSDTYLDSFGAVPVDKTFLHKTEAGRNYAQKLGEQNFFSLTTDNLELIMRIIAGFPCATILTNGRGMFPDELSPDNLKGRPFAGIYLDALD